MKSTTRTRTHSPDSTDKPHGPQTPLVTVCSNNPKLLDLAKRQLQEPCTYTTEKFRISCTDKVVLPSIFRI